MKYVADILIIGGRIAGAALALQLARQGLKTVVVEREPLGADTLSTHFLWPRGLSYVRRLGLLGDLAPHMPATAGPAIRYVQDDVEIIGSIPRATTAARLAKAHGNGAGATSRYSCIRRHYLDRVLAEAAMKAGAEFIHGELTAATVDEAGVSARVSAADGRTLHVRALVMAGADGRGSTVSRMMDLPIISRDERSTAVQWTYFSGMATEGVLLARRGRRAIGLAPTSDGLTMLLYWGPSTATREVFSLRGEAFRRAALAVAPELEEHGLAAARQEERFRRVSHLASLSRRCHGHGRVLLLGDAAFFKDQCTASGITHALRDAELAAQFLGESFAGRLDLGAALRRYERARESDHVAAYAAFAGEQAGMPAAGPTELAMLRGISRRPVLADLFFAACGDSVSPAAFHEALVGEGQSILEEESHDQHASTRTAHAYIA